MSPSLARLKFNESSHGDLLYQAKLFGSKFVDQKIVDGKIEKSQVFFGGGTQNNLERLPSQLDSFAIRQVKRERMISPSGGTLSLEGGCKNLGEKRVSPVKLPKQEC